jgi:hypothetical protein
MLTTQTIAELATLWREARRAAVTRVVGPSLEDAPEDEGLRLAAEVDEAELHRRLFETAVRVGALGQQALGRPLHASELPALLAQLGAPCLESGAWTMLPGQPGWRFTRKPCCGGESCQVRCDAWREAIDGLVLGLTGRLRYSAGEDHGDPCVSVVKEGDPSGHGG